MPSHIEKEKERFRGMTSSVHNEGNPKHQSEHAIEGGALISQGEEKASVPNDSTADLGDAWISQGEVKSAEPNPKSGP